jgi:primase-polymerase (primpol)-like protein
VLAPNPEGVQVYLKLPRWVLWRTEQRVNRKTGEISTTKPPISYHTSKQCDVTDPRSWTSFEKVMAALGKSATWDGAGFALRDLAEYDEILIGLDLDNCLDEDGALAGWAMPFLVAMASYAETSPSGTGIKCIARIRRVDLALARKLHDVPEGDRGQARTRVFGQRTLMGSRRHSTSDRAIDAPRR